MIDREKRLYLLHVLLNRLVQIRVHGQANLPKAGGSIVVCNHTDYVDALIQGLYTGRELSFLAKAELFDDDLLTRLELYKQELSGLGVPPEILEILDEMLSLASQMLEDFHILPIIRNYRSGRAASNQAYYDEVLLSATEILNQGRLLAIYPEGERSESGVLQDFKGFAARLALRAQVPVIPTAILGAHGFSKPINWFNGENFMRTISYRIGEPILPVDFPDATSNSKKAIKELTAKMHSEVLSLLS